MGNKHYLETVYFTVLPDAPRRTIVRIRDIWGQKFMKQNVGHILSSEYSDDLEKQALRIKVYYSNTVDVNLRMDFCYDH